MKELVEAGQAIIGIPETCTRFINKLIDAGVDEVCSLRKVPPPRRTRAWNRSAYLS
jgi:hypothetical protein